MCLNKPRKALKQESEKTHDLRTLTNREWFKVNPPDEKGVWICYLQISPNCPVKLTRSTIQLEHVKSKARHPELKYEISNLKPACNNCNQLKRSLDVEDLEKIYNKKIEV
jgi:hypothetical protein